MAPSYLTRSNDTVCASQRLGKANTDTTADGAFAQIKDRTGREEQVTAFFKYDPVDKEAA